VAIIHRRGRHLTAAVSRFIAQLRSDDARGASRSASA
jgi:hypothetical protein